LSKASVIKINFRGGIISPGDLYNILVAVSKGGIRYVSFGLRQQLIIEASTARINILKDELVKLQVSFENDNEIHPNIVSSYPATGVFIAGNWLSEGVYKDIFDGIEYEPAFKINISDSGQSFTPLLTGNINWVASSHQHFWHLLVRFPKTNIICEWRQLTYTNNIATVTKQLEKIILAAPQKFIGAININGDDFFNQLDVSELILKEADNTAVLPAFNLPYYEGLNRYNDKNWLGIYRRDEHFLVDMLKEMCLLCLQTKVGQICSTPWKSLIIKGIEDKDRKWWNQLLSKYHLNVRHAANELNFQVEDNCRDGLELKNYLVKYLNNDDTRTFGICFGIKTRRKSEVFSSILIRRRPLIKIATFEALFVYDILCAKNFNPNERTGVVFSSGNPKFLLAEQLRRAVFAYYNYEINKHAPAMVKEEKNKKPAEEIAWVHQCKNCLTVYDKKMGEPQNGIKAGTAFENLPQNYCCSLCEAPVTDFVAVKIKNGLLVK
jgi:rubredoxin